MFQLLQPIWLYAMAGVAVPIIIHLWDVRGGKKLKVGSILLIEESAKLQGRSLRLTDVLLLILRCLVILLLAIVLSKPIFKKQLLVSEEKGWLLIAKESLHEAYKFEKPRVDSLITAGYKFHYFNDGFAEEEFATALKTADSIDSDDGGNFWSLLRRLDEQVPPELPIHVIANAKLNSVAGQRPELSMSLTFHSYVAKDTVEKLPALAYKTKDDSVRILTSTSSNESFYFQDENVPSAGNNKYKVGNNKIWLAGQEMSHTLEVDTATINVIIFADQNTTDAKYLSAAIEAVGTYTERIIKVVVIKSALEIKSKPAWLFWLSEKPLPIGASAEHIFIYAKGKSQTIHSWIRDIKNNKVGRDPIGLSRRIQIPEDTAYLETLWSDGFGHPLLTKKENGNNVFHFYTRFNPAWTELPWSSDFAEMIFHLILPVNVIKSDEDKRVIAKGQLQPDISKIKKIFDKAKFVRQEDWSKYFWMLAFLIFAAERILSLKNKKEYA